MKKAAIMAVIMLAAVLSGAQADIVFDKCVNVKEAPNFWYNPQVTSNTTILAFNEKQGVEITSGVLNLQHLNKWDDIKNLVNIELKDAVLDSHMVYFQMKDSKERRTLTAEIEFDNPILGFVADNVLFDVSNPLFAPNPTHKQALVKAKWSLEEKQSWTELDKVTVLSPTRIAIEWTNHSATDPLRVITMRPGGKAVQKP
jgi:hypothetical protein